MARLPDDGDEALKAEFREAVTKLICDLNDVVVGPGSRG